MANRSAFGVMSFHRLLLSTGALFSLASSTVATSITGGGETVETTPTPRTGFTQPSTDSTPTPMETPAETVEPSPEPMQSVDLKRLLKEARIDFKNKNYDDALEKVRKAEVLRPDQPELVNFRGAIYAETGRYAEAVALYEKSLSIDENSFWPAFNICEVDFIQGRYADARAKFKKMLEKLPKNELLRFKVFLTYLLEKDDKAAKAELDKFTFPANTAAFEFANAAWFYAHGDATKGKEWVDSGTRVFGLSRTEFTYQTLADLKWVPLPRPTPNPSK